MRLILRAGLLVSLPISWEFIARQPVMGHLGFLLLILWMGAWLYNLVLVATCVLILDRLFRRPRRLRLSESMYWLDVATWLGLVALSPAAGWVVFQILDRTIDIRFRMNDTDELLWLSFGILACAGLSCVTAYVLYARTPVLLDKRGVHASGREALRTNVNVTIGLLGTGIVPVLIMGMATLLRFLVAV